MTDKKDNNIFDLIPILQRRKQDNQNSTPLTQYLTNEEIITFLKVLLLLRTLSSSESVHIHVTEDDLTIGVDNDADHVGTQYTRNYNNLQLLSTMSFFPPDTLTTLWDHEVIAAFNDLLQHIDAREFLTSDK